MWRKGGRMNYTSEDLPTYHAALNLPKSLVSEYSKLILRWETNSGIEWTVSRCKEIYTDYVRYRAGLPLVGQWYKKNSAGLPAGILSHIFKLSLHKKRRFSCSVLLRSYTSHISKKVLPNQMDKFLKGVESPDIAIPSYITEGVLKAGRVFGPIWRSASQPSYISYQPSPGKRVPLPNGKTGPELDFYASQWVTIDSTDTGLFIQKKYHRIFNGVFKGFDRIKSYHKDTSFIPSIDAVGKIGLIQEPGLKLRAVANPNRVYQVALKPLGEAIYSMVEQLPWDCTFDQKKATIPIQQHLSKQKRCHCVDLTGATDYFPLSLQIDLLHSMFPTLSDYIDLFYDISRSNWILEDRLVKWTRGQPLGLYPSFGSFAMTHGLLLFFLNDYCHNDKFFVLGDDVIILDDTLMLRYTETLKILECPVSLSKTISSKLLAEFGGKLITLDSVEPQLKWRQLSDDNFIDIVRLLGKGSLRLLRPKQRKVVKAIWDIPDTFGGIGFNPNGLPFKDRYEKYLNLFGKDDGTFLMSFDRKFNSFFMSEYKDPSNVKFTQQWDDFALPDLDQRSAALVAKHLPGFLSLYGILGTNLYSVVLDKDILPISGFVERRRTLLQMIQSKLGW